MRGTDLAGFTSYTRSILVSKFQYGTEDANRALQEWSQLVRSAWASAKNTAWAARHIYKYETGPGSQSTSSGNLERTMFEANAIARARKRGRSPVRSAGDETAADELLLYMDNDEPLYLQKKAFLDNAYRKMKKGTYSPELAVKLWMYYVERGAKAYAKEFSTLTQWTKMFTKPTRELVARELAKREAAMLHHGEYASWGFPKLG